MALAKDLQSAGVIEAQFLLPGIFPVGRFAGIPGDPGAHIHEFRPQLVDGLPVCQLARRFKSPGLFPSFPVGLLEIHGQAGQGDFPAIPIDRLCAVDLVVLDGEFLLFGQQGQVGSAEQVRFGAHVAQRDPETFRFDLAGQQFFLELLVCSRDVGEDAIEKLVHALVGFPVGGIDRGRHR